MTDRRQASVVIPALRAEGVIDRQLTCLAEQVDASFEVIVADNGRSSALREMVERWRPNLDVRVVDASARPGCGPARNVGVAHARTDRILFCDADDYSAPRWVASMAAALDEGGMATGAKVVLDDSEVTLANRHRFFAEATFSTGPNDVGIRPYASGCTSAFRREVLEHIGGFGSHNLRREDVEASWLAQDRGHRLVFVPTAKLLYIARSGVRLRWKQSFGYGVGLEALRRQFDPTGAAMPRLSTTAKRQMVRSILHPRQAPAALGTLAGQASERVLPGRYFERVRRAAAVDHG